VRLLWLALRSRSPSPQVRHRHVRTAPGQPIPEIARKLVIKTGKNAGTHPSVASLYRALAEADLAGATPRS